MWGKREKRGRPFKSRKKKRGREKAKKRQGKNEIKWSGGLRREGKLTHPKKKRKEKPSTK